MKLENIRIKVALPVYANKKRVSGGEHLLMEPGETPEGAWIHFERRVLRHNETYLAADGSTRTYPKEQTERVVTMFHTAPPNSSVIELNYCDGEGRPLPKHVAEDADAQR